VRQKSSQQKQTTQVWLVLIVEFNSLFMYLCVGEKSDLLTWAIRPVLPDPVTYTEKNGMPFSIPLNPAHQSNSSII